MAEKVLYGELIVFPEVSFKGLSQQSESILVEFDILSHDVENGLATTIYLLIMHRLQLLNSKANPKVMKRPSYLGQSIMELILCDLVEEVLKNTLHHVRLGRIHNLVTLNHISLNLLKNVR